MLVATIAIVAAATARMEFIPVFGLHRQAALRLVWAYTYLFLVPNQLAYDIWSQRKLHPATIWGSIFLIGLHQFALLVSTTGPWIAFSAWLRVLEPLITRNQDRAVQFYVMESLVYLPRELYWRPHS